MAEDDFYELLGVARNATDDEIKKAYRKRARELHPDANPGDVHAEEQFKKVSLAYEVLKDPEKRQRYDQFGIDGIRQGAGGGAGDPFGFGGMNLGDLFDTFFGGGGGFGGQRRGPAGPPPGPDIETTVHLDFEQAVFGGSAPVTVRLPQPCETCGGNGAEPGTEPVTCSMCQGQGEVRRVRQSILGQVVTSSACPQCSGVGVTVSKPCPSCRGEGRKTVEQHFDVEIPAGIDQGQTLRLSGKGGAGPRGGPAGDLYVHVAVNPHQRFERHGYDLVHTLNLSMVQAALGTHFKLQTLDGVEDLYIDAATQSGKVFKFRNKGVQRVDGRGRGDLIVRVVVETPAKLDKQQEDLLRQFAELRGEEVIEPESGFLGKIKDAFK